MKKKILLKISGEWLKNKDNIFCCDKLKNLLNQIKELKSEYKIAIVVGGGNIFRGKIAEDLCLTRPQGDSIGMLATIINGLAVKNYFNNNNLKTSLFSALDIPRLTKNHDLDKIEEAFNNDEIIIFAGGTGMPFFTTDTSSAIRSAELKIKTILIGKNGVDGIYDKDPNNFKNAKFIKELTFKEMISMDLKAVDLTCATICIENNINAIVFDINEENCFIKALSKDGKKTTIKAK